MAALRKKAEVRLQSMKTVFGNLPPAYVPKKPMPDGCMYIIWHKTYSGVSVCAGGKRHRQDAIRLAKKLTKNLLNIELVTVQEVPDFDFSGPMRNVWHGLGKIPLYE